MPSWVLKQRKDGTLDLVPREQLSAWLEANQPEHKPTTWKSPKRVQRGSWVLRDGKLIPKSAQILQFRSRGPQIIRDIEPFLNVAVDGKVVSGRKQKRDMMRAHNVVECGDVKSSDFRNPYDQRKHQASVVESLKKAFYQHGQGD